MLEFKLCDGSALFAHWKVPAVVFMQQLQFFLGKPKVHLLQARIKG
jgi:hypothetical protein